MLDRVSALVALLTKEVRGGFSDAVMPCSILLLRCRRSWLRRRLLLRLARWNLPEPLRERDVAHLVWLRLLLAHERLAYGSWCLSFEHEMDLGNVNCETWDEDEPKGAGKRDCRVG